MQRRTLLQYAGVGALSLGVAGGLTGPVLAGEMDTDFEVAGREVGADKDDEAVAVDCGTPTTVYGRIVGGESCLTAELDAVEYEDGALQFRIETVETDADCTDDCVAIEYAAHAGGLHERPTGVCVFHDGDRVARVDCTDDDGDDETDDDGDDDHDPGDHAAEDGESPTFEFDDDETPEFGFEDRDPPEFDFGDDADDEPEFAFSNEADDEPEFAFSNEADDGPDFSFSE